MADIPHYVGGNPTYVRTLSGWVYVAFARRRLLASDHRLADVNEPVTPTWPRGALRMGIWQRRREGADLKGLIHHTRPRGRCTGPSECGQAPSDCDAVASVGSKGDLLSASLWPRPSTPCTKPSSSLGRHYLESHGPWQGIDDARVRYR
ncbi:hypothetical protein [Actinomyces sp.]|uniref:hypothetical protein n=1 Tax=Actinomyces sp. TaxID=29317 RepID=UPI0026DD9B41|nr:hypothetical protein [Actinomyces sp.]MDO4901682.1 hypothetical protein [Actinomyces sp.]